ncbi:MAG: type I restriction endonuclease subunit R [Bacteroidetes bacterium]|nr:type I restriction endonuclease subunit R [Bacteroidota bacterium]
MRKHTEARLEDAIVHHLCAEGGYVGVDYNNGPAAGRYDRARALDPELVLAFIRETQEKAWNGLRAIHGEETGGVVLEHLAKELETRGMLKVLRRGFKCYGRRLLVAAFAPGNRMNPDTLAMYERNVLSVARQLHYGEGHSRSLDLVLFLNGLPVATAELKNPLSGQTVDDAVQQYRRDRDPAELLFAFKKRALVHFAVDQDAVYTTTRLSGERTHFLPFNLGNGGHAGNPPAADGGYRTAYLWREVWERRSLLDILGRFMHLETSEKRILTDEGIKKITRETMIFPRYHQLDVVRRLAAHAREHGAGRNYLVQHSAGSGKSNSIAWLAHRLSNLHDAADRRVFDSVIVVTDRRILDQQLQNTIYQFDHRQGVVQKIDEDTRQLVAALAGGTPIVITTLQKFPYINETLDKLREESDPDIAIATRDRRFAVIVDEAHSSQSGEGAMELKGVLNREMIGEEAAAYMVDRGLDEDEDADQLAGVVREMMKRGRQPNLSFFAFTATPKYRTLKVFDEPGPGGTAPFHLYTMRQAIEEKFILDVLRNYITYEAYFRLVQVGDDDPHVERKKAARALARTLTFHEVNLRTKTEVMVEHFRAHVRHRIGGRAKAMVVTEGRLHAVRYKLAFDKYIAEKGYTDVRTLVAFSGIVNDPDVPGRSWTEVGMNGGIRESELPEKFEGHEYQILLVAEKYQTGYDQPLLHTMYVDRKLTGLQAVQTLSRLNRTCPGKEDTFILDFRNTPEEIFKAFKPYYEDTPAEPLIDAQHLYRLHHAIEETRLIFEEEVRAFCAVYFKPRRRETVHDSAAMNGILDQAVERFKELGEEEREEAKALLVNFRNMYGFLSQVIPYQDSDLEQLYTYLRFLLLKLPRREGGVVHVEDEVELQYYRLQKISEGRIDLAAGDGRPLKGPSDVGTGGEDEQIRLSELITLLNERFGTEFTQADQLFFDQIQEEAIENDALRKAAAANTVEDFRYVFMRAFEGLAIDRMEGNEEIFGRLMSDSEFRGVALEYMLYRVYRALRGEAGGAP